MLDIQWIREHPETFDQAMQKRGEKTRSSELLELDKQRRESMSEVQLLQAKRNQIAKEVGQAKSKGLDASALLEESKQINLQLAEKEKSIQDHDPLAETLSWLPNILIDEVPYGESEKDNVVVKKWGEPKSFAFEPKEHWEIGEKLGMMDFEAAAQLSGSRFVVLRSGLARLERALANFMLDIHTREFGYQEVVPPLLVKDQTMFGTTQLPKFGEDSFKTNTGHWLIPTSEVSLTNLVRDAIWDTDKLPFRFTAYTPCFRSEAGSAGKDTRGMIRQHQFSKVEMVSATIAQESEKEHQRMLSAAETVLQRLELPYEVMLLCSQDTGFASQKTYDINVWLPGQKAYREISSCSNCGDFQARRMKARHRVQGEKHTHLIHTLNGSGLAIGRTIVAILENYQEQDGSVRIPSALLPYMDGLSVIKPLV
ncbi:MAG: serine--tRNA ligase [Alphaproteobacteria bacterium]|nr:serine--tRNA ligase [Alphaproteobacteria bacterium]